MSAPHLPLGRSRRWIVLSVSAALLAALVPLGGTAMAASATQLVIVSAMPSTSIVRHPASP